jgi:hypothetical protein
MLPPILSKVQEMGFAIFTKGDYNLNLIGVRSSNPQPNKFDDLLFCIYKENGQWIQQWWNITTDPGTHWIEHPLNKLGCACVVEDRQYRGVWKLGKHRNKYLALVQTGAKIAVYRDDDRDPRYDFEPSSIVEGFYGINCHRATTRKGGSVAVDKWSAGCQVFQDPDDFDEFMAICKKQKEVRGWESYSYTLLKQWW